MLAKSRRPAFTLIELLTVMAIIVVLIGILTPSLTGARVRATQTAIKAQINAMSVGLVSFNGDEGKFPASNPGLWASDINNGGTLRDAQMAAWEVAESGTELSGAHILVDALVGRDFLGYDPLAPLVGPGGGSSTYNRWDPVNDRRLPYIPVDGVDVTSQLEPPEDKNGQYADLPNVQPTIDSLNCQVFRDKFGWPILYYRAAPAANPSTPIIQTGTNAFANFYGDGVFDGNDNRFFTSYAGAPHKIIDADQDMTVAQATNVSALPNKFAEFIRSFRATTYDVTVTTDILRPRPVKADTFIILSAGKDGIYGTIDDAANFEVFSTER